MLFRARVHDHVLIGCLNPIDVVEVHERDAFAVGHRQARQRRGRGLTALRGRREQTAGPLHGPALVDAQARAIERREKAGLVERLEHVVDGADLEGAERVVVERRHEDGGRNAGGAERVNHAEAVDSRHLDVEQQQIDRHPLEHFERLFAVAAFGDDLDARPPLQQDADRLARVLLVVDDRDTSRPSPRRPIGAARASRGHRSPCCAARGARPAIVSGAVARRSSIHSRAPRRS